MQDFVGELGQFVEDAIAAEAHQASVDAAAAAEAPADPNAAAAAANAQAKRGPPPRTPEAEAKREERIRKLTVAMLDRLRPFVDGTGGATSNCVGKVPALTRSAAWTTLPGNVEAFQRTTVALAQELVEESFGPEMLEALGYYYELKGLQYIGANKVSSESRAKGGYGEGRAGAKAGAAFALKRGLTGHLCPFPPGSALSCLGPLFVFVVLAPSQLLGLAGMYHGARERVHAVKEAVGVVSIAVGLQVRTSRKNSVRLGAVFSTLRPEPVLPYRWCSSKRRSTRRRAR